MKTNTSFNVLSVVLCCLLTACNFTGANEKDARGIKVKDNYVGGEMAIQHGMELFNQHCANCHNFNVREIGPSLNGITSEVSKEWLTNFIKDPKKIISNGDKRAVAQFEKYKLYMPAFPNLNDNDLEDLLGFIHKFSEAEKRNRNARPGGLLNPIVEKIATSDLHLVIEEWLTVPPSAETTPLARINKMSAVTTKSGERLFIADLRGKLYEIKDDTVQVYLDVKEKFRSFIDNPGWGNGLGSFAFHPEFEVNGLFYTTHTEPAKTAPADFAIPDSVNVTLQWAITEWEAEHPSAKKFTGQRRELLRVDMLSGAHGFQELTFNPFSKKGDSAYGMLYLGIGDGASALSGHPHLCDNAGQIWGSVIRFDPSGRNSINGKYGIPKDNPFSDDPEKLREIWARGFRNPHRISWNPKDPNQMLVSNIGQHSLEEVDLVKKGRDYGWPNREGTFLYDVNANTELVYPLPDDDSGYSYPVIQYDHDEGNAVSGGFVYSGNTIPLLKGKYIFGDIPRGTLFFSEASQFIEGEQAPIYRIGLELNGKATNFVEITQNERVEIRFGMDNAGELYIFTKSDGKVYRVIDCRIKNQHIL